jgi:geranylgeranyl pyrophosphate synthase
MDDYSDYFCENSGKERLKDLKEGLVTMPLIYLLKRCSSAERRAIKLTLNNINIIDKDIKNIISLMRHYDVPAAVSEDVEKFLRKAAKIMPEEISQRLKGDFDILSCIRERIRDAQKEYCRSGRGIRRS